MNDSFGSGGSSSDKDVNLPRVQEGEVDNNDAQDVLKTPKYHFIDSMSNNVVYKVDGYFREYKQDINTPTLFRCLSADSSTNIDDLFGSFSIKLLFRVCKYLSLIQAQTQMFQLNKASRQFLQKQNYGYYMMFLKNFNLPKALQKQEFLSTNQNQKVTQMNFIKENVLTVVELAKQRIKAANKLEEFQALKATGEDIPDQGKLLNVGEIIKPFTFYSDGGILYDDQYYSMLNLFSGKSALPGNQIGYQASLTENVTLCSYLGRQVSDAVNLVMPSQMKVKEEKNNPQLRVISIDKYLADPKEPESHKIISQLDYYQQYPTYEYRCQSFFMFTAEKDNVVKKSSYLKFFQKEEIPTLKAFRDLGLPLKKIVKVTGLDDSFLKMHSKVTKFTWSSFGDTPEMVQTVGSSEVCYEALDKLIEANDCGCVCEIDVSNIKLIESILGDKIKGSKKPDQYNELLKDDPGAHKKKKLDFVPFLYVWNVAGTKQPLRHWSVKFEQTICAKYIITKIIDKQSPLHPDENQGEIYLEPSILFGQLKLYGSQLILKNDEQLHRQISQKVSPLSAENKNEKLY